MLKFAPLVFLAGSFLVSSIAVAAPPDEYIQTVWTTEDGLPQNSVTAILQSRDGYLWLGTFGGLARFDGIKFTIFNSGNTPGLKNNRIVSLCEGRDGALWMGAESGEVMRFKDGAARTYTTSDGLLGGIAWAVHEDRTGTLWAGTHRGIGRLQAKGSKPTRRPMACPATWYGTSRKIRKDVFTWRPMPA